MTIPTAITVLAWYSWMAVSGSWRATRLLLRLFATILDEAPLLVLLVVLALIIATE